MIYYFLKPVNILHTICTCHDVTTFIEVTVLTRQLATLFRWFIRMIYRKVIFLIYQLLKIHRYVLRGINIIEGQLFCGGTSKKCIWPGLSTNWLIIYLWSVKEQFHDFNSIRILIVKSYDDELLFCILWYYIVWRYKHFFHKKFNTYWNKLVNRCRWQR